MFTVIVYICIGVVWGSCGPETAAFSQRTKRPVASVGECSQKALAFEDFVRAFMGPKANRETVFRVTCERVE